MKISLRWQEGDLEHTVLEIETPFSQSALDKLSSGAKYLARLLDPDYIHKWMMGSLHPRIDNPSGRKLSSRTN